MQLLHMATTWTTMPLATCVVRIPLSSLINLSYLNLAVFWASISSIIRCKYLHTIYAKSLLVNEIEIVNNLKLDLIPKSRLLAKKKKRLEDEWVFQTALKRELINISWSVIFVAIVIAVLCLGGYVFAPKGDNQTYIIKPWGHKQADLV